MIEYGDFYKNTYPEGIVCRLAKKMVEALSL
jgi:hypothetical protein